MPDTLTAGKALATKLTTAGVPAFTDVRKAAGNLPCVLIPPPRLAESLLGDAVQITWQLYALAADGTGSEQAWAQLVTLVDGVCAELPVELAEPTSYQLTTDLTPVPAYRLTVTDHA